ncbi:uncharacterized protein LOC134259979, partial [Saccostrea cucullata]|uniref:uncharacterized protein LOC134259979 n=1 Tax=Saccostrea cuccullata TaxID=36930 RepID=UPI002ED075C4
GTVRIIVGSTLAVFLCASACLILLYLKRKRKLRTPTVKFTNKACEEKSNIGDTNDLKKNANYINNTSEICSRTIAKSDHDDIYVENAEGEYDILHSSRQKKSSDDNPQYDSTIGWENVYSSTTQNNANHGNWDESDYNTMNGTQERNLSACPNKIY